MSKNKIYLRRQDSIYIAGFGVINYDIVIKKENFFFLHPHEKVYYDGLRYDHQKTSYLLGKAAAKNAIKELIPEVNMQDLFIDRGVFDFPVVKGVADKIQVSVSHCEHAGIAIAFPEEHPLAVDLEKVDTGKLEAMKRAMTALELKQASECELTLEQYCTMIWTIKEGLSKILKTGLTLDFKLIELQPLIQQDNYYISTFKNFGQYKAISYCCDEYVCSVVLPKNTDAGLDGFFDGVGKLIHGLSSF